MPALTSYSPFETLVFFQNVARHGTDALAFEEISATLKENQLIREGKSYDSSRFSPSALQSLYDRLIRAQSDQVAKQVNGDTRSSDSNPRKRKLSASPPLKDEKRDETAVLQSFVDKLYARFREESIKEIRHDEQEYEKLQSEIKQLEEQVSTDDKETLESGTKPDDNLNAIDTVEVSNGDVLASAGSDLPARAGTSEKDQSTSVVQATTQGSPPSQLRPSQAQESAQSSRVSTPGAVVRPLSNTVSQGRLMQPNQLPSQPIHHPSPGPYDGVQLQSSPQNSAYTSLTHQHGYAQGSHPPQMLPVGQGYPQMPMPLEYATGRTTPTQGRASPAHHSNQPSYPQYPQYSPMPSQWHSPVPSQPYMHPQHGGPPVYLPSGRSNSVIYTPNQPHYQQSPHSASVPYANQQQWQSQAPVQYANFPISANATPIARPGSRPAILRSNSSTPWKRRTPTPGRRAPSPSRLEREISPLSDHESPPPQRPRGRVEKRHEDKTSMGRSSPPAHTTSRSQSILSHASETASEKPGSARRMPKIKAEPPSTPAAVASDTDQQRSSGRRGRPRNSTANSRHEPIKTATAQKRKRESIVSRSPSPVGKHIAIPQTAQTSRRIPSPLDVSLLVVSKNFSKTSQLLLNEITSHKLAGIFAKPLSERDAPGYKDLVRQTQDLKSIKAATSKGSRVATAAIEELETNESTAGDGDATSIPKMSVTAHGEGSIGNGFYFVKKSEEMLPPKGIVNSSQLEMELVRMFANAVMFNPLPSSERGFGRNLRLRKMGGDVISDQDSDANESVTSEDETTPSGDEDGIIADAREMFDDVMQLVVRWRDLEGERLTGPNIATPGGEQSTTAARHTSVSASSAVHEEDDEAGGVATPSAGPSTVARKRRRIGDH